MKKTKRRSGRKNLTPILVLGVAAILIIVLCVFLIINNKSDGEDNTDIVNYETTEKYTNASVSIDNTDEATKAEGETTKAETGESPTDDDKDKSDEIEVVSKTIERKDTLLSGNSAVLDITYPNIPSSEYKEKADVFNEAVVDKIDSVIFEYDTKINENSDSEILNYTVNYTLCKNTDNIVSVIFNTESFFGGAHESNFYSSINFSMETGKILTLNDILGGDKTDKIVSYVYNIITADPSEYYPEIDLEAVKDGFHEENFAIVDNNIKIFFQDYDIAPYAAGFQSFDIPISELK